MACIASTWLSVSFVCGKHALGYGLFWRGVNSRWIVPCTHQHRPVVGHHAQECVFVFGGYRDDMEGEGVLPRRMVQIAKTGISRASLGVFFHGVLAK